MLARYLRFLGLIAALVAISASSQATFHLWRITQLYSNADGTVQFIELTALASGQQYLTGHTIKSSQGATTHSYTFTMGLPGDSADMSDGGYGYGMMVTGFKSIVIGTQGFAAMGVVTPDYIVPNGFLFTTNGTVNWGEGSDVFSYAALPTDGRLALMRAGNTDVNSPKNFNGEMGTVNLASPSLNYQALWQKSPANSESGWGVNITHQGDILFATWFTYDTNGNGMWLVMSSGNKTGPTTYSGALYSLIGPAFSVAFDATQVHLTPVGTATFTFTDGNNGTFAYTVNGISQSKSITRYIYSSPVPVCTAGGTPGAVPNFQDLWWRSPANSESGWGVNITHQGDILFATWFTFATNGQGLWLVMSSGNKTATNTYSGVLYRTVGPAFNAVSFDQSKFVATPAGNATFTFSDSNNGVFAYTVDGVTQSKPITRDAFASPATVCK
jgi:hypothetical protein